eukprot:scaffold54281_cov40-Phaeocystis_antarctica.AAC.1
MKARTSWYMVSGRRMVAKPTSTSFLNCVGFGGWGRRFWGRGLGVCAPHEAARWASSTQPHCDYYPIVYYFCLDQPV